jgi:hypothetical protein
MLIYDESNSRWDEDGGWQQRTVEVVATLVLNPVRAALGQALSLVY